MNGPSIENLLIPEWADQSSVLIAWPFVEGDFQPWLASVEAVYAQIGAAISTRETLIVACRDDAHREHIGRRLSLSGADLGTVRTVMLPYNDVWVRDTAPLTVRSEAGFKLMNFRFNGWGNKYEHAADAAFAERLYGSGYLSDSPLISIDYVLEGGSIESDGEGTLLTTTRCLLNPNRNGDISKTAVERRLRTTLGALRVLWLEHGHAEGDDTDAHVDTLARFCSVDTIAFTACDRESDPLFHEFQAMQRQLEGFRTVGGAPYRLVPLPVPKPIFSEDGSRLPATYANFLIINGAVLVPIYDDPADFVALDRLASCFPEREIVPIDCRALIRQYGSLHCMTMQFPSGGKRTQ